MELKRAYTKRDPEMFENWFNEYKKIGGIHTKNEYDYFLDVFFAITCEAFTGGDVFHSGECYKRWENFMGNKKEAKKILQSVDNITAYT